MKLQPHGVWREPRAGAPRPHQRVLSFLDVLLGRAAVVIEGQHPLVGQAAVGDDETHTWEQLAGMELHFGHDPARLRPTLRPVVEAGVVADDTARRPTGAALGLEVDPFIELSVAFDADGVVPALSFQQIE